MKNAVSHYVFIGVLLAQTLSAQTLIPIPDTLAGTTIMLTIDDSVKQFYSGVNTNTIGYNGSYLGPTLILHQGDNMMMMVHNELNDTTTTHWHGLHVPPMSDGGPHTLILPGGMWMPHFKVMDKAATYWYHPHPHGKTMAQIVKGAAGLIIVRDNEEAALALPRTYGMDDIPLIFQFETFDSTTKQIIVDDKLDNAVLVNGTLNGMVNAPAQVVRLRLLNASSLRFFRFGFADNRAFHQITSDDGLLDAPVSLTRLDLSPGERAEILVDFSGEQGDTVFLKTYGSEFSTGYPGGPAIMGMAIGPLDNIDFTVLQINVTASTVNAITSIPSALTTNIIWSQTGVATRNFDLTAQPMMSMDNFFINGVQFDMGVVNFSVQQESIEMWHIENQTFVAHPFHVHGNYFYVLDKNGFLPPPNERGRKDVVIVPAMSGVTVVTKFSDFSDTMMSYMYHCHILSHEDKGMMGQFTVSPVTPLSFTVVANDVSCFGGSDGSIYLTPSGGVLPYSFLWSTGDTIQNLSGLTAGPYDATITDSYNSSTNLYILVNQPQPIDIGSISGDANPTDSSIANYSVIEDSQYTYQWFVTNGVIISGQGTNEAQVQWFESGEGEVMVIAADGTCSDTAVLATTIISRVNEIYESLEVKLIPNPGKRSFTVNIKTLFSREIEISVFNILGQSIYTSPAENISSEFTKLIKLENVDEAICLVKVRVDNSLMIRKVILTR